MPRFRRLAVWRPSTSRMELCCGPKLARKSARRCTWCLVKTGWQRSIRAGLKFWTRILRNFRRSSLGNHTLKRALSDPRLFSGIGNAYSDEILFQARLSPLALTQKLKAEEIPRLFAAARDSLVEWTERLRRETGDEFPEKVTAFRPGMAVHGRYKESCLRCGEKIQRIRYAANETNYCPQCQTGGKLLADRALSRLLREDWPKTPEGFEILTRERR